jgi:hypothetical protein
VVTNFKFQEGDRVTVTEDHPSLDLKVGDVGTIWCLYAIQPPAYEVTFTDSGGHRFDMTMYEDEIALSSGCHAHSSG